MTLRDLDFARGARVQPMLGWMLLVCGMAILAAAMWHDWRRAELTGAGRREQNAREARLRALAEAARPPASGPADWRRQSIHAELAFPWPAVFCAVESATQDPVHLLSLKIDRGTGVVELSGEAPELAQALQFVHALNVDGTLSQSFLQSYQRVNDPYGAPAVRFVATGHGEGR